jgi:FkbM family methyltransferase
MKYFINDVLRRFGYRISRISPDEGLDVFELQKKLLGENDGRLTILDVGAYHGDIAFAYRKIFPESIIYCFEPFPQSFSILQNKTSSTDKIFPINKGLGEFSGKIQFNSNKSAATNSILGTLEEGKKTWRPGLLDTVEIIEIELDTLDNFVSTSGISKIDILKLDVQGSEYMVLNGARDSLDKGMIRMIYSEIITTPTYEGQKYLDEFMLQLRSYGFYLYNFFNYSSDDKGMLRQLDAIFIMQE